MNEEKSAKELQHLLDLAEKKIEQHELLIEQLQIKLGKKGTPAISEVPEDSKIYLQTEGTLKFIGKIEFTSNLNIFFFFLAQLIFFLKNHFIKNKQKGSH